MLSMHTGVNRAANYEKLNDNMLSTFDCTEALKLDPTYVKALLRRSTMRKVELDYKESFDDLVAAEFFDTPENRGKYDFSITYNSYYLRRAENNKDHGWAKEGRVR